MNYLLQKFKKTYLLLILIFFSCEHQHSQIDSTNQRLFYKIKGAGKPTLVMLHGLLGSHRYWDGVVPELSRNHELLLMDLLGFGESQKPPIEYTVAQHLVKIEDVIEHTQLKESQFIVVGHSMGAFLALNYAIAHPNQVRKLVLINAPMNTDEESLKKAIAENSSQFMVTMTFSKVWGKLVCKIHELMPSISYPLIRILEPELPPAIAQAAGQHSYASYSGSFTNILLKQKFYDLLDKVPEIPVLIIASSKDEYSKDLALVMLPQRSNLKVVKIDGNHNVLLSDPDRISKEILKFIELNY